MSTAGRKVSTIAVTEWREGSLRRADDYLAAEEPLEIRVGEHPVSVTMRTPGDDLDLAAGFLFTEGLIESGSQIASIRAAEDYGSHGNRVIVELAPGTEFDFERGQRNFYVTSSCGICGKASLDAVRARGIRRPAQGGTFRAELLCELPERLRAGQKIFGYTGGLHAAGLFDRSGGLLAMREDIGRHNAVDKVIGWALGQGLIPLSDAILMVSGRGGFEIAQKGLVAGIPVLASVSAPSDLAVELAREFGMTMVGFLRERRFVVYSGAERISGEDAG